MTDVCKNDPVAVLGLMGLVSLLNWGFFLIAEIYKKTITGMPELCSILMLQYLGWRDWLTMFSVSTRLKNDCDFMMGHNILPKDCIRIPGKKSWSQGDGDTGKDIIITKWIYDKMTKYGCNKKDISDLIIELLFEDRDMVVRRSLDKHWFISGWATTLFFNTIENGDPYSGSDYRDKRIILLSETLKWKVLSRNPKYDNFSTFYANDGEGLSWAIEKSDGEGEGESDGGEHKSCTKNEYVDRILETHAIKKIVDSIIGREIEKDRFWKSSEGIKELAIIKEAEMIEREREQSYIDTIRQRMILKYGGKQNKTYRRKARRILRERHERVCGSVTGREFCDICNSHTICTKCWTCVPWKTYCCKIPDNKYSFRNECHLHGLHHNMMY